MVTEQDLAPRPPTSTNSESDAARLFEELYVELRRIAAECMRRQPARHTLQTTALVGEAYVRLARRHGKRWKSRRHFMAAAARTMRCVLVDHARAKSTTKRWAPGVRIPLDGLVTAVEQRSIGILDLDAALIELEALGGSAARAVEVVELRFLCGLTMPEIANALESSTRTVERDWQFARAWLALRLE